ncbi:MAG: response regulator [Alphaproteobacteria bacterium]|nr:response regulator [Alphaproteobacteria bacterium]
MKSALVVHHSRVIRLVAHRILERLSFAVEDAEDGAQALLACRRAMPDILLLGHINDMDEAAVVRSLRAAPNGAGTHVILCTIENDTARITDVMQAGADDFLFVPFDGAALKSVFAQPAFADLAA